MKGEKGKGEEGGGKGRSTTTGMEEMVSSFGILFHRSERR